MGGFDMFARDWALGWIGLGGGWMVLAWCWGCENIREGCLHLGFKVCSGAALMLERLAFVGS